MDYTNLEKVYTEKGGTKHIEDLFKICKIYIDEWYKAKDTYSFGEFMEYVKIKVDAPLMDVGEAYAILTHWIWDEKVYSVMGDEKDGKSLLDYTFDTLTKRCQDYWESLCEPTNDESKVIVWANGSQWQTNETRELFMDGEQMGLRDFIKKVNAYCKKHETTFAVKWGKGNECENWLVLGKHDKDGYPYKMSFVMSKPSGENANEFTAMVNSIC